MAFKQAVRGLKNETPTDSDTPVRIIPPHWIYVNVLHQQMCEQLGCPDTQPQ